MRAAVVGVVLCARVAHADCGSEATELRRLLTTQAHAASVWNTGWAIGYATASLGELGLAASGAGDRRLTDVSYVGGAKAGLGALSRVITPLSIAVPPPVSDACADRDALRVALAIAGRKERATFVLTHVGAIVVNLAGAAVLFERGEVGSALVSIAIAYPVGLASAYTIPRGAWHRWRATATVVVTPTGVAIAGPW